MLAALMLDIAELIERFLELAGEAGAVEAQRCELGTWGWGLGAGGAGRQAMAEGILRRTLFAGLGARAGGGGSRVREVIDVERKIVWGDG